MNSSCYCNINFRDTRVYVLCFLKAKSLIYLFFTKIVFRIRNNYGLVYLHYDIVLNKFSFIINYLIQFEPKTVSNAPIDQLFLETTIDKNQLRCKMFLFFNKVVDPTFGNNWKYLHYMSICKSLAMLITDFFVIFLGSRASSGVNMPLCFFILR